MNKYRFTGYSVKFGRLLFVVGGALLIPGMTLAASLVAGGGYSVVSDEDAPGRAAEYRENESSPTFDLQALVGSDKKHLYLNAGYSSENDYRVESSLDVMTVLHVNLRLEKLFHNLDHIPYQSGIADSRNLAVTYNSPLITGDDSVTRADYSDQNPADEYSLDAQTFQLDMRYKLPDIPAHINLGYWRYQKEGSRQLRFMDEDCATACHLQSRTRKLDRVTNEFTASADSHLGFFDLIVSYLYRDFKDQEDTPRDTFSAIDGRRLAGSAEHSEDPDSKMQEATLAVHTSLSGGIVANLSYTLGKRENQSLLKTVSPVEAEVNYYKAAGDFAFTPSDTVSMILRLRQLDMNYDNSDTITSSLIPAVAPVRENLDFKENVIELISTWRLNRKLQLKALLKRGETQRDNVDTTFASGWQPPAEEIKSTFKMGGYYKSRNDRRLNVNTTYTFEKNSVPAYATSSYDSHELSISTSFQPALSWGVNATARAGVDLANYTDSRLIPSGVYAFERNRERQKQNVTFGIWTVPARRVSLNFNYGFFRTDITQDLLFGNDADPQSGLTTSLTAVESGHTFMDRDVEFLQQVHMLSADLGVQLSNSVRLRLAGRYVRATAEYSPDFDYQTEMDYLATAEGLADIGRIDLVQSGAETGIDWRVMERLRCGAEISYVDYHDKNMSTFDGSVTRSMVNIAYVW